VESLPSQCQDIAAHALAKKGVDVPLCHFG
jgi:hypothetical protein